MANTLLPVQTDERNTLIDILRGFALLGVLIANLTGFVTFALPDTAQQPLLSTPADQLTEMFVTLLVENKFITLFSLLFGYGFGVIIERAAAKGIPPNQFFTRRMAFLFGIGIVHLGIWWGEILSTYALCGALLLLFRKASNRTLLISGILLLFVVCPCIQALRWIFLPNASAQMDALLLKYFQAIKSGNILRIAKYNYKSADFFFLQRYSQIRDMAEILAKFLFGYYILRRGFLSNIPSIPTIKKTWLTCLAISLLYMAVSTYLFFSKNTHPALPARLLIFTFERLGILCLSATYALSLALLYYRYDKFRLFNYFRAVGRLSLTNYLTHTVFYVFIYYGIGLGLLGEIHLQWTVPLALLIYSFQVMFSAIWLKAMLYGPVEWVWRQVTYKKRLPLRRRRTLLPRSVAE
ncbi:MAG: DUF418 domain-containing protein [Bacteroidetes bacterium]|nr:DUF418 domain-containing protein [Bacteroidota bacterium]